MTTDNSTTPDDPADDPADETPGVPDNTKFGVSVGTAGWSAFIHQDTLSVEGCSIASGASPREYISCTMEVPEGSMHFRDIQLDINIPPQMCRYVRKNYYYYYN